MARYDRTIAVKHRPEELFELVSDIRRYPEFVRWIRSMSVSGEKEVGGVHQCIGEARVGFAGLTEMFATTVAAHREAGTIVTDLIRGPFRRLHNRWRFEPDGQGGTRVQFHIDYEFRNPFLQALLVANFDRAVNALIASFLEEADRRYGGRRRPA